MSLVSNARTIKICIFIVIWGQGNMLWFRWVSPKNPYVKGLVPRVALLV